MAKMKTLAIPEQQRLEEFTLIEDLTNEVIKLKHEVWKLQKEVCYWQEGCQNISEQAYEEHLEKGGSM